MKCPQCLKKDIYVSSDGINSWCKGQCGYFAHFQGQLFFLGTDEGLKYAVRPDGSLKSIKRIEQGDKVIIEEQRLNDLEVKFKQFINTLKINREEKMKASDWWFNLSDQNKIKIWKLSLSSEVLK